MTGEAWVAICMVLLAGVAFCMCYLAWSLQRTKDDMKILMRDVVEAVLRVTKEREIEEVAVMRKLLALKRSEGRLMKARAQMEIATRACWRMLGSAGGKASGRKRRGEDQQQGGTDE